MFETEYADPRAIVAWVLELGDRARLLGPPELVELAAERLELIVERHGGEFETAKPQARQAERPSADGATTARATRRSGPSASRGSSRWRAS